MLIRQKVLWPEKSIEYVQLTSDAEGKHYGCYVDDELVSVISLFMDGNVAQFRKFATLEEKQGKGYGTALLKHLFTEAKKMTIHKLWCNARVNTAYFYKNFGMNKTDTTFLKGDVDYVIMEITFK